MKTPGRSSQRRVNTRQNTTVQNCQNISVQTIAEKKKKTKNTPVTFFAPATRDRHPAALEDDTTVLMGTVVVFAVRGRRDI